MWKSSKDRLLFSTVQSAVKQEKLNGARMDSFWVRHDTVLTLSSQHVILDKMNDRSFPTSSTVDFPLFVWPSCLMNDRKDSFLCKSLCNEPFQVCCLLPLVDNFLTKITSSSWAFHFFPFLSCCTSFCWISIHRLVMSVVLMSPHVRPQTYTRKRRRWGGQSFMLLLFLVVQMLKIGFICLLFSWQHAFLSQG